MESPFFCNMDALTAEQGSRYNVLAKKLWPAVLEFKELPDGYTFRFKPEGEMVLSIAEFITLERLCCPFFALALEIESDEGPLWLKITGRKGIKPFIRAEFSIPFD